jgi:hypothetical protein
VIQHGSQCRSNYIPPGQLTPCPPCETDYVFAQRMAPVFPPISSSRGTAPNLLVIDAINRSGLGAIPAEGAFAKVPARAAFLPIAFPLILAGGAIGWALAKG